MSTDELEGRARERVGATLGKYVIERLLGVGGMAAVYAARHRNGNRVAVKVLHRELSVDGNLRQRFLREGYVANAVEHAGVVRVLDDDTAADGSVFLVMELLEGETLEARLRRKGTLDAADVLSLTDQLLDVLAAAHARGILHRDIKPENLFLTNEGRLKVLDFGIAKVRDASRSSATRTGTTMGTPTFMSPEQALGRTSEVDARSDLWAVGATMFTLMTGHYVHTGESVNEVLVRAATQRAPSLAAVLPGARSAVVELVDHALTFERDARWPDARAMQEATRNAYYAIAGSTATLPPRTSVVDPDEERTLLHAAPAATVHAVAQATLRNEPSPRRYGLMIAAACVAVGLVATLLWAVALRPSSTPSAAAPAVVAPESSVASPPGGAASSSSAPGPSATDTVRPASPSDLPAAPSKPAGGLPRQGKTEGAVKAPPAAPDKPAIPEKPAAKPKDVMDRRD